MTKVILAEKCWDAGGDIRVEPMNRGFAIQISAESARDSKCKTADMY
jgi:hypothetical protein